MEESVGDDYSEVAVVVARERVCAEIILNFVIFNIYEIDKFDIFYTLLLFLKL